MNNTTFENIGYHKDFYVNGKYIGYHKLETYNGKCGYASKEDFIANRNLTVQKAFNRYAVIKKGQHYTTQIIPLCGRVLGTQNEKIQRLSNSQLTFNK